MPKLLWISDDELIKSVSSLLKMASAAKQNALASFGKNVIDPFSAIFEIAGFNMTYDEWVLSEEARQAQKTLQNFIGEFHQKILGSCAGWEDMGRGHIIDIKSDSHKIIAEVKNKHNTISGGLLADLYYSLESAVMDKTSVYKGYTAYHVSIIPKKVAKFNTEFTPSNKQRGQRCPANPLIRQIDGCSFYSLVTGRDNALEELFDVLPFVINHITGVSLADTQRLKLLFSLAYG